MITVCPKTSSIQQLNDKGHGGGTIKRKLLCAVLLIFAVTLFISASDVSAATVNQSTTNSSISSDSDNQTGATAVSPTVTFSNSQISTAASQVKNYTETNNQLPEYVTISTTQVTMAQFLQLLTDDVIQINNGSTASITLKIVNTPVSQSETVTSGTIYKSEFLTLAQQIKNTIDTTGKAPASISTSKGTMKFENLVYNYAKIMSFYGTNKRLPNSVSVKAMPNTSTTTTNTSNNTTTTTSEGSASTATVTFTTSQISTAASTVKTFKETNNRLPDYVTISNTQVTMAQFLQLLTYGVIQINNGSTASITLKVVNTPVSQSETVTSGTIYKSEFLTLAQQIKNTIDTTGKAPASISTSQGTMKFENLVYNYAKILAFYGTNKRLPNSVSVKAFSNTTNTTTNTTNTTTSAPSNGYGPYNVVVTSQYVSATAKCSCGNGTYTYQTGTYLNYCPQCKHYGTLIRSTKNPEYEGQWTCTYCDCDYCMQCGKEKMSGTKLWLTPYTIT